MSLLELLLNLVLGTKNELGSGWALFLQQIQVLEFHLEMKMSPLGGSAGRAVLGCFIKKKNKISGVKLLLARNHFGFPQILGFGPSLCF